MVQTQRYLSTIRSITPPAVANCPTWSTSHAEVSKPGFSSKDDCPIPTPISETLILGLEFLSKYLQREISDRTKLQSMRDGRDITTDTKDRIPSNSSLELTGKKLAARTTDPDVQNFLPRKAAILEVTAARVVPRH